MNEIKHSGHLVLTIGAGPAGIYGVRKLAEAGHEVIIINRDIKPGGLVEYGIYLNKHKLKEGVRQQFRKILSDPHVHYLGHIKIGNNADLTLDEIRDILKPSAVVIAVGAQGTKSLGIPGDETPGVYHAKDLVYHYNGLPPYSEREYPIGNKVAIIGIGNVMVDIAHWLVHVKKIDSVIAIARRGPAERAYTDVEIQAISANIDHEVLHTELERVSSSLKTVDQNIETILSELTKHAHVKAKEGESPTKVSFRFLSSPKEILSNDDGSVRALLVENNELIIKGDSTAAKSVNTFDEIDVDTVIFAVGDRIDEHLGLPHNGTEYHKNPNQSYEVYDPESEKVHEGTFVIGWSRKASDGVVGKAKQDGERGMAIVNQYLESTPAGSADDLEKKLHHLHEILNSRNIEFVDYSDIQKLEGIEKEESEKRSVEFFKYSTDAEMLREIKKGI